MSENVQAVYQTPVRATVRSAKLGWKLPIVVLAGFLLALGVFKLLSRLGY